MSSIEPFLLKQRKESAGLKAILWGGVIAGVLDLAFAIFYYGAKGATVMGVLKSIAAGWLGKAAMKTGGLGMAALGVASHFLIATGAAAVFWAASWKWPVLVGRCFWASGMILGAGVYFFMNGVVMPLSAYHAKAWPLTVDLWVLAAHLFLVGLPIAWVARRV
ncbi:hypothetical protein CMV30_03615 [Nibricoccus aquaticus]|uniref:DUF1440 domain-containing protein n=1 Tax=Nibricoccus aquaticus TaxID=2576891 RepID=A0A290QA52_9BACT|nr:hypothetical protein [Nibricoccus aquaticus]ATC63116.1 hypothetical protein CMV30_03615 [Nibricoccus aquaticus]